MISLPVKEKVETIAFLTSDIVRETQKPVVQAGYKEGYLTKRGKNFGGWKTRYFVLQGPSLEYYESVSAPSNLPSVPWQPSRAPPAGDDFSVRPSRPGQLSSSVLV